jgi:hypothetical protein
VIFCYSHTNVRRHHPIRDSWFSSRKLQYVAVTMTITKPCHRIPDMVPGLGVITGKLALSPYPSISLEILCLWCSSPSVRFWPQGEGLKWGEALEAPWGLEHYDQEHSPWNFQGAQHTDMSLVVTCYEAEYPFLCYVYLPMFHGYHKIPEPG